MKQLMAGVTVGLAVLTSACNAIDGSHVRAEERTRARAEEKSSSTDRAAAELQKPVPAPSTVKPGVNPIGAATKEFLDRVAAFVALHNKVESTVPQLTETSDPAKVSAREKAFGEALIKARPDAKQGDIFVKEYQPILLKLIREDFAKRSMADRKALIVELPKGVKIGVNQIYPTTIPLATSPGRLLKVLPELPPELEYRIVGRDLILRAVKANVVVDIMPNVFQIAT